MAASDSAAALLKYRLRLEGHPQMESGRHLLTAKAGWMPAFGKMPV